MRHYIVYYVVPHTYTHTHPILPHTDDIHRHTSYNWLLKRHLAQTWQCSSSKLSSKLTERHAAAYTHAQPTHVYISHRPEGSSDTARERSNATRSNDEEPSTGREAARVCNRGACATLVDVCVTLDNRGAPATAGSIASRPFSGLFFFGLGIAGRRPARSCS
jgi:hypothetical protein